MLEGFHTSFPLFLKMETWKESPFSLLNGTLSILAAILQLAPGSHLATSLRKERETRASAENQMCPWVSDVSHLDPPYLWISGNTS